MQKYPCIGTVMNSEIIIYQKTTLLKWILTRLIATPKSHVLPILNFYIDLVDSKIPSQREHPVITISANRFILKKDCVNVRYERKTFERMRKI